ncbi:MAG: LysM peptidoglycan-binding domain-containing protein [Pirellulales bacterium]|nr:LysM peptidoglycan-binding domain-containing protein [Pirellulales bacterium]
MSRSIKLLIVGFVLVTGIGLSLPFRKSVTSRLARRTSAPALTRANEPALQPHGGGARRPESHGRQVVAKMTSTVDRTRHAPPLPSAAGFDLDDHPAFARGAADSGHPVTPQQRLLPTTSRQLSEPRVRPAYETIDRQEEGDARWPREVLHVVTDGDTLEMLASRYMGDSSHALEIFDMNRKRLSNPHQLPIGAELRVPVAPGRLLD